MDLSTEVKSKVDNGALVAKEHGIARSPHWPTVEKEFKKKNPDCLYCGEESGKLYGIQVHHINAFHVVVGLGRPDLELDERNLVSLDETEAGRPAPDHHIVAGHNGSFQKNNPHVLEDVSLWKGKDKKFIESTQKWQEEASSQKPFSQWSLEEKKAYRKMLDEKLPPNTELLKKYNLTITTFE